MLTITERLRRHGVVGKFVEFFGPGLAALTVADRATISNMSPEFGSTSAMFPVDERTLGYLRETGREPELVGAGRAYCREQGLFRTGQEARAGCSPRRSTSTSSAVEPSLAGPRRPQDRVPLGDVPASFSDAFPVTHETATGWATARSRSRPSPAAPTPPTRR